MKRFKNGCRCMLSTIDEGVLSYVGKSARKTVMPAMVLGGIDFDDVPFLGRCGLGRAKLG
jgi:hypothetical protein